MKKQIKLKHLIIAVVALAFLLFFASSMFSSYKGNIQLLKEHSLETNKVYAEKLSQVVDLYLNESLQSLKFSATNIEDELDNEESLSNEVEHLYNHGSRYNSVVIANEEGLILAGAPAEYGLKGKSISSKEGLQLIKDQQPNISNPYQAATGKTLITISHPIFTKDGKYKGLINGTIYIHESNYFGALLGKHFYEDGSYVYVVDSEGRIIYHQDSDRVDDNVSENEVVKQLKNRESGAMPVTNTQGVRMLAGYSPVEISKWGIVAQTPEKVALQPVGKQVLNMLMIELPLIIISIIIVLFAVRKITKPLQNLAEISEDSIEETELEKLKNLNVWYYEVHQLKNALIHSFSFLHSQVNLFIDKSSIDPLTGLTNRRTLDEVLLEYTSTNFPFSAIMLDLDFFKKVNDTFGHAVGDEVLKFLADEMEKGTRKQDICCRFGGEEFIIILPETSIQEAYTIAENLRKTLENKVSPCGRPVTFSAGVASFPETATNSMELIKNVDTALYEAKRTGRNRVVIAKEI